MLRIIQILRYLKSIGYSTPMAIEVIDDIVEKSYSEHWDLQNLEIERIIEVGSNQAKKESALFVSEL